MEQSRRE
jgi:hypothetical protein